MVQLLFIAFIAVIGGIFLGSAYVAHFTTIRHSSAWWAGIGFALMWLSVAYTSTIPIPRIPVNEFSTALKIDWATIYNSTITLDFKFVFLGIIIGLVVLEVMFRFDPPKKAEFNRFVALNIMLTSMSMLSLTFYIFLFRTYNFVFFSILLGIVQGILLYIAFRGKDIIYKMFGKGKLHY